MQHNFQTDGSSSSSCRIELYGIGLLSLSLSCNCIQCRFYTRALDTALLAAFDWAAGWPGCVLNQALLV